MRLIMSREIIIKRVYHNVEFKERWSHSFAKISVSNVWVSLYKQRYEAQIPTLKLPLSEKHWSHNI